MDTSNELARSPRSKLFRMDDLLLYCASATLLVVDVYAWRHVIYSRSSMHFKQWVGVYFATVIGLWVWIKTIQAFQGRRLRRSQKISSPTA